MPLYERLMIRPGEKFRLTHIDPDSTPGARSKDGVRANLERNVANLAKLQYLMYAENRRALLIVLQAMDAGGKDGLIRQVMVGLNPQGVRVTSFKVPNSSEANHDFLWRIHQAVPSRGEIGIFNRSHYEDVLVVRVHDIVPKRVWSRRYDEINSFERMLADNGVVVLKFFLHISKEAQLERLKERLGDPTKHWKFSAADLREREHWDDYMEAYQEALSRCSVPHAPWFVIPANKKWYRNYAVSSVIVEALERLKMRFPEPSLEMRRVTVA